MSSVTLHDEACRLTVEYERSQNRKAEYVSHRGVGYDIVGDRFIDVKTCTHRFETEDFRIFWGNLKKLVRKNGWIYCFIYDGGETKTFYEIPLAPLNPQIDQIEQETDAILKKIEKTKTQNIQPRFEIRIKFSAQEKQGFKEISLDIAENRP